MASDQEWFNHGLEETVLEKQGIYAFIPAIISIISSAETEVSPEERQ